MATSNIDNPVGQRQSLFKIQKPDWGDTLGDDFVDFVRGNDSVQDPNAKGNDFLSKVAGALGPNGRAPQLRPVGGETSNINVHKDFAWTGSKASTAREDLPFIYMKEKLVNRSSRLQNLMYNTFATLEVPGAEVAAGAAIGGATVAAFTGNKKSSILGAIAGAAGGALAEGFGLADKVEGFLSGEKYTDQLAPYTGLYSTTDTGFKYRLPFVKATGRITKVTGNRWSDEKSSFTDFMGTVGKGAESFGEAGIPFLGQIGDGLQLAQDIGEFASNAQEALKYVFAGAHTESAKSYNYGGGGGQKFDVSFYLFNNISWEETVKNWQLVFLLQYQNLPNRLNRLIITPPVIYEVSVPGYFYSMYSSITQLDVDYIGSNFLIDMPIEFLGNGGNDGSSQVKKASTGTDNSSSTESFNVVVPEAYKVNIAFESLIPETQNLFYQSNLNQRRG